MRRNGFTRLEAGIILSAALVTVTLLVPVMAQARANWLQNQRKNQFQCMNNLKTIGMSILLYNQDYDEWHPPVAAHEPRAHGWADLLYPDYVKDRTAFQCPSEKMIAVIIQSRRAIQTTGTTPISVAKISTSLTRRTGHHNLLRKLLC